MSKYHTLLAGIFAVSALATLGNPAIAAPYRDSAAKPPQVMREFRGAWVATVYNLDWPSKAGLSTAKQKAELLRILDRAAALKLNAVLLQVRPSSDALYASKYEPWSSWLTGTMGKAPDPFYDPLEFAVAEAHARGLELHAWLNPFRAMPNAKLPAADNHVSRAHPEWIVRYGNYLWLDPANPEARAHVLRVIQDIVRRYDIDGIHFDDYFYPYPTNNDTYKVTDFRDDAQWAKYRSSGGKLGRADWRRENINSFVREVYSSIHATRPGVKFGISPFGIWKPGVPKTTEAGLDSYDQLYADSRHWLAEGWLDYLAPQLYWSIQPAKQSFSTLLDWWSAQNARRRHLWPGIATERIGQKRSASEIVNQIALTRRGSPTGHIHWSMKALMTNLGGIGDRLEDGPYAEPAVAPACPWLSAAPPGLPRLTAEDAANGVTFQWEPTGGAAARQWIVQQKFGDRWRTIVLPGTQRSLTIREKTPENFAVTALSATGIAGEARAMEKSR